MEDQTLTLFDNISKAFTMADVKITESKEINKKEAKELIIKEFPETIISIEEVLDTPQLKKTVFEEGEFPEAINTHEEAKIVLSNKEIIELIANIKPFMVKFQEDAKIIKKWIPLVSHEFRTETLEVDFEEEMEYFLESIRYFVRSSEYWCANFFDEVSRYFMTRAESVKKIVKHPNIEDYKNALKELDYKEYLRFCCALAEIRNVYAYVHDVLVRNLDLAAYLGDEAVPQASEDAPVSEAVEVLAPEVAAE